MFWSGARGPLGGIWTGLCSVGCSILDSKRYLFVVRENFNLRDPPGPGRGIQTGGGRSFLARLGGAPKNAGRPLWILGL
jgi:hypothetical protein